MSVKPRILIIEDNPINVIVTKKFIEDYCQVDTATNAKTALQKISENQYNMILTDLNLGDDQMTGFDILNAIRNNGSMQNTPVIAITAYSDDLENNKNVTSHQFSKIIKKPVNKEVLIQVIQEYLTI